MDAFVSGWNKEFHSKEHLLISYITIHVIGIHVENKVSKNWVLICVWKSIWSEELFITLFTNFVFKVDQTSGKHSYLCYDNINII